MSTAHTQPNKPTQKRLEPMWSLLHPVWWVALGMLAINDHMLKGAGVLPGWFTGKLSDFAGLFLAPPLLAALLKVRSRPGLMACYGATGLVFSAIQLSEGLAAHWIDFLATMGVHWRVWSDPTDLLALPMLWASWKLLEPEMHANTQTLPQLRGAWRRTVQAVGATSGALLCMATSPPPEPPPPIPGPNQEIVVWDDIIGQVFVRNATEDMVSVRIRTFKNENPSQTNPLDCTVLAASPGTLIQDEVLAPATTWEMPANSNMAIDFDGEAAFGMSTKECWAALIEVGSQRPQLVFITRDNGYQEQSAPGGGETPALPTAVIELDSAGRLTITGQNNLTLHNTSRPDPAEVEPQCQPQPDADRLAWSDPPWSRDPFVIDAFETGPDGCLGITLRGSKDTTPIAQPWYVCMPAEDWPFEVGNHITPNRWVSIDAQLQALVVERIGRESGEPLTESLVLTLNAGPVKSLALDPGVTLQLAPIAACDPLPDTCGTVARSAHIQATYNGEQMSLRAGERGVLALEGDATLAVTVIHAQHRALVLSDCAVGPTGDTDDAEVVLIHRAPIAPPPSP